MKLPLFFAITSAAMAVTPIVNLPPLDDVTPPGHNHAAGMLGWTFTVHSTVTVTGVGWLDAGSDGLYSAVQVGLWKFVNGTPVTIWTGSVASGDPLLGGFRIFSLQDEITLDSGFYQLGGLHNGVDGGVYIWTEMNDTVSTNQVTVGPFFAYDPNIFPPTGRADFGPVDNYYLTTGVEVGPMLFIVPEPSSIMIGSLGTLVLLRRRRNVFATLRSGAIIPICDATPVIPPLAKHSRRVRWDGIMAVTRQRVAAIRTMTMVSICLGMLAVESEAAITFSNPVRSVSAINDKGASQEIISYDLGQFNESARVDWEEYWDAPANTTGQYISAADHDSIIGLTEVVAKGSADEGGPFYYWGQTAFYQSSQSFLKVNFTIDTTSTIYMKGFVSIGVDTGGTYGGWAEVKVSLSGANGDIYSREFNWFSIGYSNYSWDVDEAFTLFESGDYVFEVSAESMGYYASLLDDGYGLNPGYGSGSSAYYDITLVPEPSAIQLAGLVGVLLLRRNR